MPSLAPEQSGIEGLLSTADSMLLELASLIDEDLSTVLKPMKRAHRHMVRSSNALPDDAFRGYSEAVGRRA